MWKYVTRRIRDTIERSVNSFDIRSASSGLTQQATNGKSKESCLTERSNYKCCGVFGKKRETNKQSGFDYYIYHWIGAITWSSALVLGWYGSQLIRFKRKDNERKQLALTDQERNKFAVNLAALALGLVPSDTKKPYCTVSKTAELPAQQSNYRADTPQLISNELEGVILQEDALKEVNKAAIDSATQNLSNVLNSIENRLGLAAIQNGDHEGGLSLLRSAAKRNHAPALYNLALCYEQGLGLPVDDKMAMELYRSAAKMEHPTAIYNLAVFYGQGRGGLAPDRVLATRLLHLAAYKGQEDAIKALEILEKEKPVNTNLSESKEVKSKEKCTPFSFPVCPVSYDCDMLKDGLYVN